jgi:D-alanine-D-alanine ligase
LPLAHPGGARGPALDVAFQYDTLALAERYLPDARDLEVALIGNDPARLDVYGPGEVLPGREFYDFVAKYTPGMSETSLNAEVPRLLREQIRKLARDAYRAIGAEGFARVDFLLASDGIYVSEINTVPGFTPISLFPTLPAEGGDDFTAVCLRVLALARARHEERAGRALLPDQLPR